MAFFSGTASRRSPVWSVKIHEYRMFFHRKENIVQFIEAWHGFSFIFCVQVRSRKEKGANSTHPERGTAKRLCQE
jgi:hypothetical protein